MSFCGFFLFLLQASKAGLCIYRPGMKMEEEESQGWLSWMWNWGGEADATPKEVKTGGMRQKRDIKIKKNSHVHVHKT